eukprot:12016094-Ditylum_brightwellii.AAC.1
MALGWSSNTTGLDRTTVGRAKGQGEGSKPGGVGDNTVGEPAGIPRGGDQSVPNKIVMYTLN